MGPSLLALALVAATGFALFQRSDVTREAAGASRPLAATAPATGSEAFDTKARALPPNHPPMSASGADRPAARDEAPALAWTAPPGWEAAPSRSTMRLATYRVPTGAKGGVGAELTVTRAGGSTAENLDRWVGQFDAAGKDTRAALTIAGFHVTTLDVSGTYDGGMSSTGTDTASSKPGWSLLGAVVETGGPFYFFKMVGPSDAVHAARPAFDALVNSVRKAS